MSDPLICLKFWNLNEAKLELNLYKPTSLYASISVPQTKIYQLKVETKHSFGLDNFHTILTVYHTVNSSLFTLCCALRYIFSRTKLTIGKQKKNQNISLCDYFLDCLPILTVKNSYKWSIEAMCGKCTPATLRHRLVTHFHWRHSVEDKQLVVLMETKSSESDLKQFTRQIVRCRAGKNKL